jgi:hypothetical protein
LPANSQLRQWNPGNNQPKSIKYGIIKNKPCAELYFPRKSKDIILFLWLPIPNRKKQAIARMQVHTNWDVYW